MKKIEMTVKGVRRNVYVEACTVVNKLWRARIYVGSKVVSGKLTRNKLGVLRFTPIGVNADLV